MGTLIKISTHNFCVVNPHGHVRKLVVGFIGKLVHAVKIRGDQGKVISENTKVFATSNKNRTEFRLHIN